MKRFKHIFLTALVAVAGYATSYGQASLSTHNHMDDDILIRGMKMAPDGGSIYTGYREDATLGKQMVLVRADIEGNIIWQKEYGSTGEQQGWDLDFDGFNVYVVGTDDYQGAGGTDIFVMKFNGINGNESWTKPTYLGGSYDEEVRDIATFTNGDVVIAGSSASYTEDAPGNSNKAIYCARLNTNGALTWETAVGGKTGRSDWANALVRKNDVITLTGVSTSWSGSTNQQKENIFMLQLDFNGAEIDFRHYGTSSTVGSTTYYSTDAGLELTLDDTYYYVACFTNYNGSDPAILRVSRTDLSSFSLIKYENTTFPSPGHDMLRFEDILIEGQELFLTGRGYDAGEQVTFIFKTDLSLNIVATEFHDLADDERGFALAKAENGELTVASRTTSGSFDELAILRIHPDLQWDGAVECSSTSSTAFSKVSITVKTSNADPAPSFYSSTMSGSAYIDLTLKTGTVEDHLICTEFDETFERKYSNCFDGTSDVWQAGNYYNPDDIILGHNDKVAWCGSRVWQHATGVSGDAYPHAFFALMDPDGKTNVTHLLFKATDVDDNSGNVSTIDLSDSEDGNDFLSTWAKSINPTADGGYILLGQMQVIELDAWDQYETKHKDLLVIKLNSSKQIEWTRRVGNYNSNGDYNQEYAGEAIQVKDASGNVDGYMIVGSTQDKASAVAHDRDNTYLFMASLSQTGALNWTRTIFDDIITYEVHNGISVQRGSESNTTLNYFKTCRDHAETIIQTGSANNYRIYIAGRSNSYPGSHGSALLMRYSVQVNGGGNQVGIDRFVVHSGSIGQALYHDEINDKILMGINNGLNISEIIVAETDCSSGLYKKHTFENSFSLEAMMPDPSDAKIINVAGTRVSTTNGTYEFAAMQVEIDYSSNYNDVVNWAKRYPDGGVQKLKAATRLANTNMGMIGHTNNGANLCTTPNNTANQHALFATANLTDGHSPDCENTFIPVIKFEKANYSVAWSASALDDESGYTAYMVTPTLEEVTPSEASEYTCGLDPAPDMGGDYVVSVETLQKSTFKSFPNPFSDQLQVELPTGASVRIFDLNGKVVFASTENQEGILNIETTNWIAGMYTIEMVDANGRQYGKVIKQ